MSIIDALVFVRVCACVFNFVLSFLQGETPFQLAIEEGHKNVASLLLDGGADINQEWTYSCCCSAPKIRPRCFFNCMKNGVRPFHRAIKAGHQDMVVLLLERGADIYAKDRVSVSATFDIVCACNIYFIFSRFSDFFSFPIPTTYIWISRMNEHRFILRQRIIELISRPDY